MKGKILEQFEKELFSSPPAVRKDRVFYAKKFLDFAGDRSFSEWDRYLVADFIKHLKNEGYSDSTIKNKLVSIVKRVFDAAKAVMEAERQREIERLDPLDPSSALKMVKLISLQGPRWDVKKVLSGGKVEKPTLSLDEAREIILTAKNGSLPASGQAFVCLSSIYGLRREELLRIKPQDLDFKKEKIFIKTCKGGEERWQHLPGEIFPYLSGYSFNESFSPAGLSEMFCKICRTAGVNPPHGSGFHSFRRLVDTLLVNEVGELKTKIFMRWKLSMSSEMTERYYSPSSLIDVDKEVIKKHPLFKIWIE